MPRPGRHPRRKAPSVVMQRSERRIQVAVWAHPIHTRSAWGPDGGHVASYRMILVYSPARVVRGLDPFFARRAPI
jgi:hypothetical protein